MRREFPEAAPLFAPGFQNRYWRHSRLGYGRLRPALTQLRVKTPKRVIVPLSVDAVARPRCGEALFVCLKGPARGNRMTPAGLRSRPRA
jgi:hypothetical protein